MADAIIGRVRAVISADTTGLDSGLQRGAARLDAFGSKATAVGRTLSTRLTLPLVAAGAAAVKTAADFEKSMASIVGLVGVAADEVKAMEGSVRSMAKAFGSSATEAGNALFFITSAGLRGSDATDTLEASLKAAAVGLGEVSTIADLATSALNAYGSDTLSATAATDVLTAAVREGKLEASQLAGSMGGVLPIASAMGVQFHEVGAAFAALSRTGTNAAEAATQINGILGALLKPTQQAEKALRTMGLSSEFLRANIKENGLLDTLKLLAVEFDGNAAATASVFGNVRALKGVMDLMGANVAGTEAIFASMADTTGTVDAAFEVMADTASFKFKQAMAEAKDSLLTVGQAVMPLVTDAAGALSAVIESVGSLFGALPSGIQGALVALGGVAAIAGPVALGIGAIAKAIAAMTTAAAAHPVLAAMTVAIAGAAAIMGHLRAEARHAAERQESLTQAFRDAGDPATVVVSRLTDVAESMGLITGAAGTAETDFSEFMGDVVLMAEVAKLEVTDAFNGLSAEGQAALRELAESDIDLTSLGFVRNFQDMDDALGAFIDGVNDNTGAAATLSEELFYLADSGQVTVEELENILVALDRTNTAYEDHNKEIEKTNKEYVTSGQIFKDFGNILGTTVVAQMVAGAEATGDYTGMLLELEGQLGYAIAELGMVEAAIADVADEQMLAGMSANDMARMLSEAGDAAGYDKRQVMELATQLGILDQIDPSVMVELGLDVTGADALIEGVSAIIAAQRSALEAAGAREVDIFPALRPLYELRKALQQLGQADTKPSGGGGGGYSAPIDEAARAAEEAQMAVDRFGLSVQRLGDGLVGRDFAEKLLGSSPEQIVEQFRSIATEAMAVAEAAGDLGLPGGPQFLQQIADIGDAFDELAAKAAEVAAAQEELAAAQGVLASLRSELAGLEDRYAEWQDETDGVTSAQERLNAALESSSAASAAFDDATRALDRMAEAQQKFLASSGLSDGNQTISDRLAEEMDGFREAQRELDNLKKDRERFEGGVRDMFNVRLSPDTNVMGQTQRIVAQARELRDNITALKDRGFPADVLQQVAQAGLAGGAKLSRHLLRLSQGDLAEFLAMRAEISSIGGQVATIAGEVIFGADVAGAEDRLNEQRSLVAGLYDQAVAEARQLQEEARLAMEVERAAVEAAFEAAIAEAQQKVEAQEQIVSDLETALEAAQQDMADLTYAIQNDLATAFNTFLAGLGSQVTALTTTPALIDVNVSPTESLSSIVSSLETLIEQAGAGGAIGVGAPPGGGGGGSASTGSTYTVASGDSLWGIATALLGSGTRWREIARANGQDPAGYGSSWAIHAGDVLQIPARAMGGPVAGRKPYLVGEMGPELFVPGTSGSIIPNHAMVSGGDTYNITVNMPTGVDGEDVVKAIEKYTRRRGAVAMPTTNRRRF